MKTITRRWTGTGITQASVLATLAILALSTASSLLGLFRDGHYGVVGSRLLRLQIQDAVVLVVAVPALAISLWAARRGSHGGRIAWLGSLAYMTYLWASVAGTAPFNAFFLGYVTLFGLSLFTLIDGLLRTDPRPIKRALDGELSRVFYATFLALLAVGLAGLWLIDIVPAMLEGTTPLVVEELGPQATHTYVLDLGVVVPSLAFTAVWLWRGRPWGYVLAGILLVMAALLAPTLTAITAVDAVGREVTLAPVLAAGTVLPPAVAAVVALRYLLVLGRDRAADWILSDGSWGRG